MIHLIARLTKSAKRLGLSRFDGAYLSAELVLVEAVAAGYEPDICFELARQTLVSTFEDATTNLRPVAA